MFTTLVDLPKDVRGALDHALPPPPCPEGHADAQIVRKGAYKTVTGPRQRYLCVSPQGGSHTFSAVLPRAAIIGDVHCDECGLPTPTNKGEESIARRNTFPMKVVFQTLRTLADGESYSMASLKALEASGKPTGRTRQVANSSGDDSPDRDLKAHWHVSADILEQFGPFVTERAFKQIAETQANYRAKKLPIIYIADQMDIRRGFGQYASKAAFSPLVWVACVVSHVAWKQSPQGTNWSNKLLRVRGLPTGSTAAWTLVFQELEPPDYLICDGQSSIRLAAIAAWGKQPRIVPCQFHAVRNIEAAITPKGMKQLPEKVADHLASLSKERLAEMGPDGIPAWFDQLEELMAAEDLPLDAFWNLRPNYQQQLITTANIAQNHQNPYVPISNAGVEILIQNHVKRLTDRRGPMFTNLPRTNLLGDLMVASSNGVLRDEHDLAVAIRQSNREAGGWSPPPRALDEPLGATGLRDPGVIPILQAARK